MAYTPRQRATGNGFYPASPRIATVSGLNTAREYEYARYTPRDAPSRSSTRDGASDYEPSPYETYPRNTPREMSVEDRTGINRHTVSSLVAPTFWEPDKCGASDGVGVKPPPVPMLNLSALKEQAQADLKTQRYETALNSSRGYTEKFTQEALVEQGRRRMRLMHKAEEEKRAARRNQYDSYDVSRNWSRYRHGAHVEQRDTHGSRMEAISARTPREMSSRTPRSFFGAEADCARAYNPSPYETYPHNTPRHETPRDEYRSTISFARDETPRDEYTARSVHSARTTPRYEADPQMHFNTVGHSQRASSTVPAFSSPVPALNMAALSRAGGAPDRTRV